MGDKSLSIVVPCYNEEKNIPLITKRFKELLMDREDVEVILVNNGSTDNSKNVFAKYLANESKIVLVNVEINQGYGYGILCGLKQAKGKVLAWTHADMQTDPEDVFKAYQLYKEKINNDREVFIKGKRKNRNKFDEFFTWGMQIIASLLLEEKLDDINAQPKLFSREFYEKIENDAPYDFSLDLYFLYFAKKSSDIYELPVFFNKRIHGEAKGGGTLKGKYKLIKRTLGYMIELKKKFELEIDK